MSRTAASKAQPPLAAVDHAERLLHEFEKLVHDMRLGHPSHRRSEDHADTGREIAREIDALFRAPTRAINPPLFVSPEGDRAVW